MKAVVIIVALGATTWLPQVISQQGFFYKRDVIHAGKRVTRQTSADQMVQNILQWLQGVYAQNSRKIRQGSLREYLPPSNTQKPRPFEPPLENTHPLQTPEDENNVIGFPPTGSVTPESPFPFVTSPGTDGVGYPSPEIIPPDVHGYPPSGETPQPPFPSPAQPGLPAEIYPEPDKPITPPIVHPSDESGSYPPAGHPVHPSIAPGSTIIPEQSSEYPLGPAPTPQPEVPVTYPGPQTEEYTLHQGTSPTTEEYKPSDVTEKSAPSPDQHTEEQHDKSENEAPSPAHDTEKPAHYPGPSSEPDVPESVPYPGSSSKTDEPYIYPVPSFQPEEPGVSQETSEPASLPELSPQTEESQHYPGPYSPTTESVQSTKTEESLPYPTPAPQPEEPVPYPGKSQPEIPGPDIPTEEPAPYPGPYSPKPGVDEATPGEEDKLKDLPEISTHPPLIKTPSPAEEITSSPKEDIPSVGPSESVPSIGLTESSNGPSEPHPTFGSTDFIPSEGSKPKEPTTPVEPPDEDLEHPPHIHNIEVECAKDMMTIDIEFNRQFDGVIYSKGFYSQPECRYVNENSGQTKYSFTVSLDSCGTEFINAFSTQGQSYLENVLVLQNEPGIQEVWDTIRSVRCLWEGNLSKSLTVSLSVGMLTQEVVTFSGDTAMAMLDIQLGKGPFAPTANGLVKIGEPMTLVVSVTGDPGFDIHVRECKAKDNLGNNKVALTDSNGCVLKPKLFGAFQKTKDTGNTGASIIAYAFFNAFKFPDMMDLIIECEIDLCKTECDICTDPNQKLEPGRRRRRDVNQTLGEPLKIGKMLRVLVPSDLSDGETIVNVRDTEKLCVTMQGFVASAALLISLLTAMSLFSAYIWLQNQRFKK